MPRSKRSLGPWTWPLALGLCLLHVCLAIGGQARVGPTYDEPIHVSSGLAYWTEADFRFQPENGNLPQRWLSLPLLTDRFALPGPDAAPRAWAEGAAWDLTGKWFGERDRPPGAILTRARFMNALLGGVLCAVIFAWSTALFGTGGGFLSLGLAVFCPNLLAHAGLATSDTSAALAFTVGVLAWWRLLHRLSPGRILAAGLATGALALAKFSSVLLAPILACLLVLRLSRRLPLPWQAGARRGRLQGSRRALALAGAVGIALLLAWGVIWAAYDFRSQASPRAALPETAWDHVLIRKPQTVGWGPHEPPAAAALLPAVTIEAGPAQHLAAALRASGLLPEAWIYGFAHVARHGLARGTFLRGENSLTGSPAFFPTAFLLKTPEAGLLALALGLLALTRPWSRRARQRTVPLLVLLAVYWTASLLSPLNLGYRHLLPTLPVCWILAGAACGPWLARGRAAWLPVLIVAAQASAVLMVRPHHLAYFNALAGGPEQGHRHLVDSSLDWGQTLPSLADWLRVHHRGEPVHLAYFGIDTPRRLPVTVTRIADHPFDRDDRPLPAPMRGGLWCLGATMYRKAYSPYAGPWSAARESRYRVLTEWFEQLADAPNPSTASPLIHARLVELESLRFARLLEWLGDRPPEAYIARGAMLVFRLDDAEISAALDPRRPPPSGARPAD